ncbi:MAG TPA: alpha/beta fold hydrolase [Capsulimonadaceae bacterium]|nr:alpha/beta fold hydrolase [Capsulimonadaceae bacterium]
MPNYPSLWQKTLLRTCLLTAICASLAIAASSGPVRAATAPQNVPFVDRQVITSTGTYSYQVFVPVHWDKKKLWPVILFLHGSGERGNDNRAQTKNGIRLLIGQQMDKFPCVVVCPQCREHTTWTSPEMEEMVLKELDQAIAEFNGNPNRLYLTGLSMGGYATWDLAQKYPAKWAAIAPCCGGIVWPHMQSAPPPPVPTNAPPPLPPAGNTNGGPVLSDGTTPAASATPAAPPAPAPPSDQVSPPAVGDPYYIAAEKVAHIPVWVFHGEADPTVPVTESRQMVAILLSMRADVRYNEYPGVGHNSWDYAYKEPGLLGWFMDHKLK